MKSILKYPGSKWGIASWIIDFFPEHHSYLEPFFGSGAVLFNKTRSNIETVNDLDDNVTNLFEWIKKDPERLAKEIYFTPYARQVYEESYRRVEKNSLYKAVNFYIRCQMGHGFRTTGERVGWKRDVQARERAYAAKDWSELPDQILQAAERLRGVQIENRPAVELIEKFNFRNVLIYCDPPYMLSTRHGKQYRKELDNSGHEELLEVLRCHKGPALVSGYDNALYNELLKDWCRKEIDTYTQSNSKRREVVWMNYDPGIEQMTIYDYNEWMNI